MRCSSSIRGAKQPYEPLEDTGAARELPSSTISLEQQPAMVHRICVYILGLIYCWLSDFAVCMIIRAAEVLT